MSRLLHLLLVVCLGGVCFAKIGRHSSFQAIGKSGVSVHAKTAEHCVQMCDDHKQCDAANYHTQTGKCRILFRCTAYKLVTSNKHQHYAKRPLLTDKGFLYDEGSDSCLKVMKDAEDYQGADYGCRNVNGRLASLTDPELNRVATKLLKDAGVQYAWIGLTDNIEEGNPVHASGVRVSETGFFPRSEQGHRNDTTRNCWSLTDSGEWTEQSCKDRKQYSICQIAPF